MFQIMCFVSKTWSAKVHGSLKCDSPAEVFTLLKASDFVTHDLCHSFDHCGGSARKRPEQFTLVLRRWHSLNESNEFRVFVRDSQLIAVSQRHTSFFFEHLQDEKEVEDIHRAIAVFFQEQVLGRFAPSRFAFDVYVDIAPRRRVWLVDFSPWGPTTDACLFDWDELAELEAPASPELASFQTVRNEADCRGKVESYHRVPLELAQLNSGEGLNELLANADRVLKQKEQEGSKS
ncbi:unnamed protein product [Polarella glacialis]|uniref:Cell division cycle protein 123 n=1 Tax=Polarella glacialis TaxID=89957 RepID=A0A813H7X5_POLGL|nr:unnamed protein product [Polarella glacialis]